MSIFGDFTFGVGAGEASLSILLHVLVSLYLEILRQCWGRGRKFDYTSFTYIWRFYVLVSIFGDFTSVLGQGKEV